VGETRGFSSTRPVSGTVHREAPEIDGIVHVPDDLAVGSLVDVTATGAEGPDLWAEPRERSTGE
jgi:hypothetical protein